MVALSAILVTAAGCQGLQKRTVGTSVQGRPIEMESMGHGDDVVLIMATIHGDEPAGTPLVRRLATHLAEHPGVLDGRRVLLMPLANPDGYAAHTRFNVHGIDLNRNFPADNFDGADEHGEYPLSEPESKAIHRVLISEQPSRIVTIHQPLACIDFDGPGDDIAAAMAEWSDLPVRRLGSRPGSLGSFAGLSQEIPIITLELPESASGLSADELWNRYGKMLLAAIRYPDRLE